MNIRKIKAALMLYAASQLPATLFKISKLVAKASDRSDRRVYLTAVSAWGCSYAVQYPVDVKELHFPEARRLRERHTVPSLPRNVSLACMVCVCGVYTYMYIHICEVSAVVGVHMSSSDNSLVCIEADAKQRHYGWHHGKRSSSSSLMSH